MQHPRNVQQGREEEHLLMEFVPDNYMPQWMYEKAAGRELDALKFVPNQYKTQQVCNEAVER